MIQHILLLLYLAAATTQAFELPLPANANIYYGPEHGVIPNDGKDDSDSLKALIKKRFKDRGRYADPPFIYLPKGTYQLSQTIEARADSGTWSDGWLAGFILVGESRTETIIQLKDNCAGFTNPEKSAAVFRTGSESDVKSNPAGGGNRAFRHSFINFTLNTGKGNAGAVGIDYLTSNRGAIEDVSIISGDGKGKAGISMNRNWPGPGLIKKVSIQGFERGIEMENHYEYSMTMEDISLSSQSNCGIFVERNNIFIRGLKSQNKVPALKIMSTATTAVLIDSDLSGGTATDTAINNQGVLLLRNVTASGYGTVLSDLIKGKPTVSISNEGKTKTVKQYLSRASQSLFATDSQSLGLPIKETPTYYSSDPKKWTNAVTEGATPSNSKDDDVDALQAAIDKSEDILYLPSGGYHIGKTLIIRGKIRKIMGLQASIAPIKNVTVEPLIRFTGGQGSLGCILEHLSIQGVIEHASAQSLTLRHFDHKGYSNTSAGTGDLFIEDVIGKPYKIKGQNAWMRQVNSEFGEDPLIENTNSNLWILGLKTEGEMTAIKTVNGKTELLGGHFRLLKDAQADVPGMIAIDSDVSYTFSMRYRQYKIKVREQKGTVVKDLVDAPAAINLYTSGNSASSIRPVMQRPFSAAVYSNIWTLSERNLLGRKEITPYRLYFR